MSVHTLATVLAGIAYDPHIRGLLVVLVAVTVLIGGVWLILATNMGARLGFLVIVTALFGWMMLMSATWTAYGIGLVGERPSWTVKEINSGDLDQAQVEEARSAPEGEDLPAIDDLLAENPEIAESFDEGATVRVGDIADVDPDAVGDLGDWEVIGAAELGEPQTTADEALTDSDAAIFESNGDYVVLRGFEQGGKPERDGDGIVERVTNKIGNTLRITSPTHYAVVQVQQSQPTEVPEGAAPLPATPDPDQPVVSVIMVRDLGNLRLPPFILTVVFGSLFAFTAWLLHVRDRAVMANRARGRSGLTVGQYLPILVMLVLTVLFAALSFVASYLFAPRRPTVAKRAPYECGIVPERDVPSRFPVRFFLVAMIFIVFDIEIIFFLPWAVIYRQLGGYGLVAIVLFAVMVFESFVYLISKGALEWGPAASEMPVSEMVGPERTMTSTVKRVGLDGRDPFAVDDEAPDPEREEAA